MKHVFRHIPLNVNGDIICILLVPFAISQGLSCILEKMIYKLKGMFSVTFLNLKVDNQNVRVKSTHSSVFILYNQLFLDLFKFFFFFLICYKQKSHQPLAQTSKV